MAGGRHDQGGRGSPRGELRRIQADREEKAAGARRRIELAMLETCGERGYRTVSVQSVLERCGGNRAQFYRLYESKAACFEAAYRAEATRVVEEILDAGRAAGDWQAGLRAALARLAETVVERPALARGLLVEVHVARGAALTRRAELLERLAAALDSARRRPEAREDPPPLTARFMLGAVDSAAVRALAGDGAAEFPAVVPELARMIVVAYFGEAAPAEEPASGPVGGTSRAASSASR